MRHALVLLSMAIVAISLVVRISDAIADDRPNIILLLADDLGYGDLSCFGSPAVETPHLDQLAAEGMRFSRFYAASAVCSPTRASVLTGRYPLRFDITKHFNDVNRWLPESATTVAELLRSAGYNTAHVGKWHLGGLHVDEQGKRLNDQPGPRQHGFDFYQTQIEQQPLRGRMGRERTLFRQGGTVLIRNDQWISEDQHCFRSMVQHMDAKVGQILDKLDELGIADDTLVLFTSDNGAAFEGFIGDLKGGKTDLHDGGLRVPMLVRWPMAIPAGQTSNAFGHSNDLLPTFCEAAGVELPSNLPLDGLSLLPHMKGESPPSDEARGTVFWQLDLYKSIQRHYAKPKPYATEVAKRGKWKLLALDGKPVELFDVESDPNEERNVIKDHPDLVASLTAQLDEWLSAPRNE